MKKVLISLLVVGFMMGIAGSGHAAKKLKLKWHSMPQQASFAAVKKNFDVHKQANWHLYTLKALQYDSSSGYFNAMFVDEAGADYSAGLSGPQAIGLFDTLVPTDKGLVTIAQQSDVDIAAFIKPAW